MTAPTPLDESHRADVLRTILACIESGTTIRLPEWDRSVPAAVSDYALANVGLEPNQFGGFCGELRYQFEGEDDLLHLMVCRRDGGEMSVELAHYAAEWLLRGVPTGLFWSKHAGRSSHFYIGHDVLPGLLRI